MAEWDIPLFEIGGKKIKLIQGGMGVGISLSGLASAVAREGGLGNIASPGIGALRGFFAEALRANHKEIEAASAEEKAKIYNNLYASSNKQALKAEIREARRLSNGHGMIGANIMCALTDSRTLLEAAVEEGADAVSLGAGIFRNFPEYLKGTRIAIIPIINSARGADYFLRRADSLGYFPSAFVVEGPKAGGHLGYPRYDSKKPQITDNLDNPDFVSHGLERIIPEVVQVVNDYATVTNTKPIPIIAAGGIFYGGDIRKFLNLGATGVQMATRFVTTDECDADPKFKQAYIDAKKEDLVIIKSPVGMPGRAIKNPFLESVERGEKVPYSCPYHCLVTCDVVNSPYCIANTLLNAKKGNFKDAYAFAGLNAWRCEDVVSVRQVFEGLNKEFLEGKVSD